MAALSYLFNAIIMAAEIAAVIAAAWLGFAHPLIFAGVTAVLALALGLALEVGRLRNELPFYFEGRAPGSRALFVPVVAFNA